MNKFNIDISQTSQTINLIIKNINVLEISYKLDTFQQIRYFYLLLQIELFVYFIEIKFY